ncbi:uncharacterized protein LOC131591651 [Poecile atricapillus]|uniref:uncharacterized protein LOC131591651 n=1 Tax=Poecile atricapillus TaxID=48891 RepID=UPI002738AABF|nr:uncharacterized protein LOC131591651 [Poecile atricapillus]
MWAKPEDQARVLTKSILDKICGVAQKVFNQLSMFETQGSYGNIKQFPSESFLKFVNRLQAQIERQVEGPVPQAELIKEMAQRNANEACFRVIQRLPIDPPPTIAQMIEAHTMEAELFGAQDRRLGLTNTRTLAAVTPGMKKPQMSSEQLQNIICFQCKRSTHWTVIGVDILDNSQDMTRLDSEYFVIGDTAHTPMEIEAAPMTIKGDITHLTPGALPSATLLFGQRANHCPVHSCSNRGPSK